jgi:hypothetical protein
MQIKILRKEITLMKFDKHVYSAGQFLTAKNMNRIEDHLEDLYGILDAEPIITLEEPEQYVVRGTELNIKFSVSNARGVIRYTVLRDGIV